MRSQSLRKQFRLFLNKFKLKKIDYKLYSLVGVVVLCLSFFAYYITKPTLRQMALANTVYITNMEGGSGGTGFLVKHNGHRHLITNAHVCNAVKFGDNNVMVVQEDKTMFKTTIELMNEKQDLCALAIPDMLKAKGLSISRYAPLYGETVFVFGHPLLLKLSQAAGELLDNDTLLGMSLETPLEKCLPPQYTIKLFLGIFPLCFEKISIILTNIMVQPGNSGSAALNMHGEIVGVIFAAYSNLQWGILIPLERFNKFLQTLDNMKGI